MNFLIKCLPSGPLQTNAYLVISTSSDEAVVIDPAPGSAEQIIPLLLKATKRLKAIWITHSHFDHVTDCYALRSHSNVPVMVHELDSGNLLSPGSDGIPSLIPMKPLTSLTYVSEGEILRVGKSSWTVLHTPGHTMGSVCFYNEQEGILFTGDTLFKGTMGNISFPTSSPYLMGETLSRLSALPLSTKVFPGHGTSTTIGTECSWMKTAALQLQSE